MPPPPENFEINGAIWCVLGPPESFLDQRKSIYFSIKMEMNLKKKKILKNFFFFKKMWISFMRTRV